MNALAPSLASSEAITGPVISACFCHISSLLSRYYQAIDVANFTALDDEVLADDAVWEVVQHSPTGGTIEDTVHQAAGRAGRSTLPVAMKL